MSIIEGHNYYIGIWYVEFAKVGPLPLGGNLFLVLKRAPDGKFVLEFRFRYYADDKIHGSEDKRSSHSAIFNGSELDAVASVDEVLARLAPMTQWSDYLSLNCQGDHAMTKIMNANKSWLHTRAATPEDDKELRAVLEKEGS